MSPVREGVPGATRSCPHCRSTILESAVRCPQCQHHLRFDSGAAARALRTFSPLHVEGILRPPTSGESWEYSILLTVRNARGEEVGRQIMGVGALPPGEERTFDVTVEVYSPTPRSAAPPP